MATRSIRGSEGALEMFEKVTIRQTGVSPGRLLDAGSLAEALLFYEHVQLLLTGGVLGDVVKNVGIRNLLTLVEQNRLHLSFQPGNPATATNTRDGMRSHDFGWMTLVGHVDKKGRYSDRDRIDLQLRRSLGDAYNARDARKLIDRIKLKRLSSKEITALTDAARADLKNPILVRETAKSVIQQYRPAYELPADWRFDAVPIGKEFLIDTNLDFNTLNAGNETVTPDARIEITPAYISNHIYEARADLLFALDYMSEYIASPISSTIMKRHITSVLRRREKSIEEIDLFQTVHVEQSIRDVINSKERTFEEFLTLLDRADRFKSWLSAGHPDEAMLSEYFAAATRNTWAEKLPSRSTRLIVTSGLAATLEALFPSGMGMALGLGLSTFDALAFDRIFKGWRPNHFVDGPLREFVTPDQH